VLAVDVPVVNDVQVLFQQYNTSVRSGLTRMRSSVERPVESGDANGPVRCRTLPRCLAIELWRGTLTQKKVHDVDVPSLSGSHAITEKERADGDVRRANPITVEQCATASFLAVS
jgi:hypothetical protein